MRVSIDKDKVVVEFGEPFVGILPSAKGCGCGKTKTADAAPPINDPCEGVPAGVGVYVEHVERKADGTCVRSMQPV